MTLPPLYPILDSRAVERTQLNWMEAAEALLEGGAGILQLRHKDAWTRPVFQLAREISRLCAAAGVPFFVNDRADFALLLGAGLHVGQDDLSPVDARKVCGAKALIGYSTHNTHQLAAAAAEPVDYLAIGPVFGTYSKENPDPALGLEALAAVSPLAVLPLVAIGGITRETARAVLDCGVSSVAVISDLYPNRACKTDIRERMEEWQRLLKT